MHSSTTRASVCEGETLPRTPPKLIKKAATNEEKASKKEADNELIYKHGFALVDGNMQKLGNFRMEPPGLFRGRGAHPVP